MIRVGGDSTDLTHWDPSAKTLGGASACPYSNFPLTAKTTVAIAALAHTLRAKLILGINLKAHRTDWAYAEARALMAAIDPHRPYKYLKAFELGNEPDLYRRYESSGGYTQFVRDFSRWTAVVRRAARDPSVWTAGPSLGRVGFPWISGTHAGQLAAFVKASAGPRLVTFHGYPFLASGKCPGDSCPSVHNLLLDGPSHGLAVGLAQYLARVPGGRELRDDEMGAVTNKGKPGVSNTFASALWALDTLFEKASAGFGGVNVHTIPGASYELCSHPQPGRWSVHHRVLRSADVRAGRPRGLASLAGHACARSQRGPQRQGLGDTWRRWQDPSRDHQQGHPCPQRGAAGDRPFSQGHPHDLSPAG